MKRDSVNACGHMRRGTPLLLYTFWMIPNPPFPQSRANLMDDLFLNQKTNKNIRISYSLKYKHSKTIIYEKINGRVGWNKHSGEQYSGADPGLILGCCKILQKKSEHRNNVISRKIADSARTKKVQFWLQ